MKIGFIDADLLDGGTRFPNLALMKLSGYYKSLGHDVNLINDYKDLYIKGNIWLEYQDALSKYIKNQNKETAKLLSEKMIPCFKKENFKYNKIFISKVFTDTKIDEDFLKLDFVEYNGTGFYYDKAPDLPDEIEHCIPDYELYQNQDGEYYHDYSIGFVTRGCFRKCSFCVNKKYDKVMLHSPIKEFLNKDKKYICLLDDNFLGYPGWENILSEIKNTKKPFQFKQGLDIRLINDRKAEVLSNCKYRGDYIFAFDSIKDRDLIENKLSIWKKYCTKTTKLYVLVAYDSQDVTDIVNTFERIKILMNYQCLPYIMRYKDYKDSPMYGMYVNLARWCNQPSFFKKKSYREFCVANGKNSSTYKYMVNFEKQYPEVAKKYFDLKYEDFTLLLPQGF